MLDTNVLGTGVVSVFLTFTNILAVNVPLALPTSSEIDVALTAVNIAAVNGSTRPSAIATLLIVWADVRTQIKF